MIRNTTFVRAAAGAAVLRLAVTLAAGLALPAEGIAGLGPCRDETLRGHYGLLVSGVRGLGPTLTEKFVATALWTFDGIGGFKQRPGGALHGEVTGTGADPGEILGTYAVNANCTGTMKFFPPDIPFPIEYSFVIVNGGREVKAIVTSPKPNIATVELTRR